MYAPYGIAIKKQHLFQLGARPVIYGTIEEKDTLLESIKWRFEEYIPNIKDFTWLREWRLKSNLLDFNTRKLFYYNKNKRRI